MLAIIASLPSILTYEAVPFGIILVGIALIVLPLTSPGPLRRRRRAVRRLLVASSVIVGAVLVALGFSIALG